MVSVSEIELILTWGYSKLKKTLTVTEIHNIRGFV